MPDHVYVTLAVSGERGARLDALIVASHEISLRLEGGSAVIQTRVPVLPAVHIEPCGMNPPLPAEGDLGQSNGTIGYNALFCHVHPNGLSPPRRSGLSRDIRKIAALT